MPRRTRERLQPALWAQLAQYERGNPLKLEPGAPPSFLFPQQAPPPPSPPHPQPNHQPHSKPGFLNLMFELEAPPSNPSCRPAYLPCLSNKLSSPNNPFPTTKSSTTPTPQNVQQSLSTLLYPRPPQPSTHPYRQLAQPRPSQTLTPPPSHVTSPPPTSTSHLPHPPRHSTSPQFSTIPLTPYHCPPSIPSKMLLIAENPHNQFSSEMCNIFVVDIFVNY